MEGEPLDGMNDDVDAVIDIPPTKPWGSRAQVVAAVLWSSFLAACFATMVFFAFVDPELLHEDTLPELEIDRMTGYGIGFFFFWIVALIASAVAVYLIRTSHLSHPPHLNGPVDPQEPR
jgi:hypothetical protein